MFSPRFTFPTSNVDGPLSTAEEKESNGSNGEKGLVGLDHLQDMTSGHFSDDDDDDDEDEDEDEDEEGVQPKEATAATTAPSVTLTPAPQGEETEASAMLFNDLTHPSPNNHVTPTMIAIQESDSGALAELSSSGTFLAAPSPGDSSISKKAPSSFLRNRLMMSLSRRTGSSSSSSSSSSSILSTGSNKKADVVVLERELFESHNIIDADTFDPATTTTTATITASTPMAGTTMRDKTQTSTLSYPAPLASLPTVAFSHTDSSSSSVGFNNEVPLFSPSTNSMKESTAAYSSSSRSATASQSSLGRASTSSSKAELLLEASSSSRQVDLELCLGTITQLKDQLVHTNRNVEQLAAENVALQRELSISRQMGSMMTTTVDSSAVATAGNGAPSGRYGSTFYGHGRRLLQRSSTTVRSSNSSSSSSNPMTVPSSRFMSSPLSKSLPARHFTSGSSNNNSDSIHQHVPLQATLSLQHSIDENTRTLADFMEMMRKTQKAMEVVTNVSTEGMSQTSSSETVAVQSSPVEAAMKEELQAAVTHMTALAQQFQATLKEHRESDLVATIRKEASQAIEAELVSPRKAERELCTFSPRDNLGEVSQAGLQNEVLRLQQQLRIMTTHASKEEKGLVMEVRALRQECGRLRNDVLEKEGQVEAHRKEVRQMKVSLRHALEGRRRTSGELTGSNPASFSTSQAGSVVSPSSTHVAADATVNIAAMSPYPTVQDDKVVALKTQVDDLESMLRLQMRIKSNVALELHAKRQEVHELRERLGLPPTTDAASREAVNYSNARRLRHPVDQRHQARAEVEKEAKDKLSETQRQEQIERHRHHQTLRALQSQRLHESQERAIRRAVKKEEPHRQGEQQRHQSPRCHLPGPKFAKTRVSEKKKKSKNHTSSPQERRQLPSLLGTHRASSPDPVAVGPTSAVASRTVSFAALSESQSAQPTHMGAP